MLEKIEEHNTPHGGAIMPRTYRYIKRVQGKRWSEHSLLALPFTGESRGDGLLCKAC